MAASSVAMKNGEDDQKTQETMDTPLPSPGLSTDTLGIATVPSHMQGWEKEMSLCRWSLDMMWVS